MPLVTGTTTYITAEVPSGINDNGKSLIANSACSGGVEFAFPTPPPYPSEWVQSACTVSSLVGITGTSSPILPTFHGILQDVVCFRQLTSKVWEVGYFLRRQSGAACGNAGSGYYTFALPPEVPAIDTSLVFQCVGTSNPVGRSMSHLHTHGAVACGSEFSLAVIPSVTSSTAIRLGAQSSTTLAYISDSHFAAAGHACLTYNFAFQYTSV